MIVFAVIGIAVVLWFGAKIIRDLRQILVARRAIKAMELTPRQRAMFWSMRAYYIANTDRGPSSQVELLLAGFCSATDDSAAGCVALGAFDMTAVFREFGDFMKQGLAASDEIEQYKRNNPDYASHASVDP